MRRGSGEPPGPPSGGGVAERRRGTGPGRACVLDRQATSWTVAARRRRIRTEPLPTRRPAGPGDEDRVVDPSTTESDTARTLLDPKGASCLTRTSSSNAQHLAGQVGLSCSSSGSKQPTRGEILGVGPSGPQPFSARSAPPVGPETRSVDRLGRSAGTRCSGRRATPDADLILAYGRSPSPDACGPPRCCGPSCATSQQPQAP